MIRMGGGDPQVRVIRARGQRRLDNCPGEADRSRPGDVIKLKLAEDSLLDIPTRVPL